MTQSTPETIVCVSNTGIKEVFVLVMNRAPGALLQDLLVLETGVQPKTCPEVGHRVPSTSKLDDRGGYSRETATLFFTTY
jgi:hypothetical protein